MTELIPEKQIILGDLKKNYGNTKLSDLTVNHIINGMKGITTLFYQTSKLHHDEGIEYRLHTIREIVELAPARHENGAPMPEAVLWLLLTGEYPTLR